MLCGMRPLIGAAKLSGAFAIQTGSLTCSLKMTSGQPWPVRFHSWILVCIVVAPLPSPSKVTMCRCTFGWALAYACAAGSRTESTQTVSEPPTLPDAELTGAPDVDELLEQAPAARASPAAASDVSMVRLSRRDQGHRGADPQEVLRAIATSTTWFRRRPAVTAEGDNRA